MKEKIKNILRICRRLSIDLIVFVGSQLIRLIPAGIWLRIRDKAEIVGQLDYAGEPIRMVVDSWIENDVRLFSCEKEPDTVEWIENWFKPGDVFFDIEGNVGAYSLIAFQYLNGKTKIYAFEPGFVTFPQLCKNIYLNNAADSIFLLPIALSEQTSITSFHYQNLVTGGALHAMGDPIDQHGKLFQPVFTLPILSYSLGDFVHQFDLPIPNHIKIDVDGTEYQILQGAIKLLSHPDLRSILLEFNQKHKDSHKIEKLLESHGMVLHSRHHENNLYCKRGVQP